jgi:hypothetical protein
MVKAGETNDAGKRGFREPLGDGLSVRRGAGKR